MQKKLSVAAFVLSVACCAMAQRESKDSVKVSELEEIVVRAVQAPKNSPFAVARLDSRTLSEFARTGQELPFLFARTPGVVAWSENGLGTGTTYMRIRGAGDSRINVTIDGVALNSPEDQCVFWANMNSYATFLNRVEIQRGVGTSTNGDGAFGGSISLQSQLPSLTPGAELNISGGSYGTYNVGGRFGSGLLGKHWVVDGSYHHTSTNGFIHGTDGNSGSYYGGITWLNSNRSLKISYKHIGNYEMTGQAWNGVTAGNDYYSLNAYAGVRTYEDMWNMGLGRYNSLYEYYNEDRTDPANATVSRYTMKDDSLWPRTTDNFWQGHNLLNAAWMINNNWSMNATLHYTFGHGYYEEFRYQNKLKKFGLTNAYNDDWDPVYQFDDGYQVKKADFVRRKGLSQNTYGLVWNVNYKDSKWDVIGGLSLQNFEGNHYGYLTYVYDKNDAGNRLSDIYIGNGDYKYYESDASKLDFQMFAKATYHINNMWDVYGDVQYRHVGFITNGLNDKFISNGDGSYSNQPLNVTAKYNFCNPKVGISYHRNGHTAYMSYAMSHREPERNNFTDNGSLGAPMSESLHDVELGYNFTGDNWLVGINLYGMFYRNQFVQTGLLSDIGENLTTNIKNSYRMGIELTAGYTPIKWLTIEGNAAISRNQILDFTEYPSVDLADPSKNFSISYDNSTLAFSPTAVLNGFITLHKGAFKATWHTNYVSRQYLDNTCNTDRMLPHYTTSAIHLSYDWRIGRKCLKDIVLGADLNNIFNARFAQSGWVYSSCMTDKQGNVDTQNRYYQIGYIPSAGFTAMGSIAFRF